MCRRHPTSIVANLRLAGTGRAALALVALWPIASVGRVYSQQADAQPHHAIHRNGADRQWFEGSRFGLAIRWGLYSLLDRDESVMEEDKLPITQYAKLLPRFNPSRFDAGAWVAAAKNAGARYLVVATKHHDGFCMFATSLTTYDVVDSTPYHADPLKALAEACRQQKIKLFLDYSLVDWHHPDYSPLGKTGRSAGRPASGDWKRYVAYYQGQLRELCTNYGEIGGLRLDGCWDRPDADWQLGATYRLIHDLQPRALIANGRSAVTGPGAGEDFRIVDLIPDGEDRFQLRKLTPSSELPIETGWPIDRALAQDAGGPKNLDVEQVIHSVVGAASAGANFRLDVRALPDGSLATESTKSLEEIGKWLSKYGQTVYGTRRGPIAPQPWGVSTARGSPDHPTEIYLHIFTLRADVPVVFDPSIAWVPRLFGKRDPLKLTESGRGLVLEVPPKDRLPIETIVTLSPRRTETSPKAN
jgi:alpha-L-fucosidase